MPTLRQYEKVVKTIVLTDEEVCILCDAIDLACRGIETGKPIKLRKYNVRQTPVQALRNLSGFLRRRMVEQNGGERVVMPWDYQEDR